jgi:hypothetical protein
MGDCEKTINVSYPDTEPCEIKSSDCVVIPSAISYLGIEQGENITLVIRKVIDSLSNARNRLNTSENITIRVKIPITAEQIKTIGTTAVELIPSPGEGKVIKVISAFSKITFVATAFDSNELLISYVDGSSILNQTSSFISATESKIETAFVTNREMLENKAVELTGTDSTATGDSMVNVYITYEVTEL